MTEGRGKGEGVEQVTARVSKQTWRILQVVMVLEDRRSMQDVIGPVIEAFASGRAKEPEIKAVLDRKREYLARREGTVRHLRPQARRARRDLEDR